MQRIDFVLEGEYVEMNQLLKLAGICDSGDVRVDGTVELRKTCKIRSGQVVSVRAIEIAVSA